MERPRLVLASASVGRAGLLRDAGLAFDVAVSGVDEDAASAHLDPTDGLAIAGALAVAKAEAVVRDVLAAGKRPSTATGATLVLGCDSVLAHGGGVHGKPGSAAAARARWLAQRGSVGTLLTGHHLVRIDDGATTVAVGAVAATTVRFADVTDDEIDAYVATGEPLHVAGGFTIDGTGGLFVEAVDGSHANVIGLSLPLLRTLLADVGCSWVQLLRPG